MSIINSWESLAAVYVCGCSPTVVCHYCEDDFLTCGYMLSCTSLLHTWGGPPRLTVRGDTRRTCGCSAKVMHMEVKVGIQRWDGRQAACIGDRAVYGVRPSER